MDIPLFTYYFFREGWGAELSDRLFGQNKPFFSKNVIYVYLCFVGNVAVSVWLASVWLIISCDYSDWMTTINMNADWPLWNIWPISVWLSSLLPRTSVCDYWLLSTICVNFWQISVYIWLSEYVREYVLHTKQFFSLSFFLLLKWVLLYF